MRSLKRITSKIKELRFSGSGFVATLAAVVAVAGSVSMMNDVLERWDIADSASISQLDTIKSKAARLTKPESVRVLASVAKVKDAFSSAGYHLDAVRRGQIAVPRVLHASLPHDLPEMRRAQDRKAVFLRFMLPYVLEANKAVRKQRERLLFLQKKQEKRQRLGEVEAMWLDALFKEYRVKAGDFATLLKRVDTVPVSLALAQSAVESGWGTSRFAQQGNAPFGQWTSKDHAGMVPLERKEGLTHKVRAFESLKKSVDSYLRNLNTHRAYRDFREVRQSARSVGKSVDSVNIAKTLSKYSEKGMVYVTLLQGIIKKNDLRSLDDARLGTSILTFRPDA